MTVLSFPWLPSVASGQAPGLTRHSAQVVAFAFGLAASSFFPVIILGIFSKRMNREGAISGMVVGILFTASYIIYFKFINPAANNAEHWWFGISPEGIGTLGMLLNFAVAIPVALLTAPPSREVQVAQTASMNSAKNRTCDRMRTRVKRNQRLACPRSGSGSRPGSRF